jgi:biopolymer transport protein ExbD
MSMDLGGGKGGVKSDINVTPLVDVMLVLLIIMMLVAPLLQKGVDLKPRRRTRPSSPSPPTADCTSITSRCWRPICRAALLTSSKPNASGSS